jgi:hypothetical protein
MFVKCLLINGDTMRMLEDYEIGVWLKNGQIYVSKLDPQIVSNMATNKYTYISTISELIYAISDELDEKDNMLLSEILKKK